MTLRLPTAPLPQSVTPRVIDQGGWQQPIAGGTVTRLDRLGNRMAIDVTLPRMKPEPTGRLWVSALMQSVGQIVQFYWPQVGFNAGSPGTPVIRAASGSSGLMAVGGLSAAYAAKQGQWLNLVHAGALSLHMVTADSTMDGSGAGLLYITPLMRVVPTVGDGLEMLQPLIEGRLIGNEKGWTIERAGTRGLQFTIEEVK